ncbi:MAG: hypothetical protein HFJ12_05725 [Bacilli bacterium]|nr:hypothetical protein [Bacilli bacterium]
MPNYTSHIIMAEDFFIQLPQHIKLDISYQDIGIASIGQDFTFSDSRLFDKTHTERVQDFFLNLTAYIKKHRLYENPKAMAYLYGHIAHFSLDSTLHPFIYSRENATHKVTFFPLHTTIEYFIDDYLFQSSSKKDSINQILLEGNILDKMTTQMIDEIYQITYQHGNISHIYKQTLWALRLLDKIANIKLGNQRLITKVLNYKTYFEKNHISKDFLLNSTHQEWRSPFSGEKSTENFDDLYSKSIVKSLELTEEVHHFLYGNATLQKVKKAFPNTSYDTGIDCSFGKKFIYTNHKKYNK